MIVRPLGFGEIFDRAITLYLKNLWPFVGIMLVMLVPSAILQFLLGGAQSEQFVQVWQVLQHPGTQPAPPEFPYSGGVVLALVLVGLFTLIVEPFVFNAIASGVGRLYSGEHVEFRACYQHVLRYWPQLLGVAVLEVVTFIILYVAAIIATFFIVLLVGVFAALSHAAGIISGLIAGLIGLAIVFAILPLFVAFVFAMFAVIFEGKSGFSAIGSGFARIFNRREIWRAFWLIVCTAVIGFIADLIILGLAFTALFFKLIWLYVAINSVANGLIAPFFIVIFAVYYFDVLVRRNELPQSMQSTV